jgi:type I restriction enzyme S subunit
MAVEMKDSGIQWIGEIPEHWSAYPIKYLLNKSFSGAWGNDPAGNDSDIVCIRIADFDYDRLCVSDTNLTLRNVENAVVEKKQLVIGDLLIEKSGGGQQTPVGRVVMNNINKPAICSNFIHAISTNAVASSKFLLYVFCTMYNKRVNLLYFMQTTGIQNLQIHDYLNQHIYLPMYAEQEKIASFLDTKCGEIDELVDLESQMIDELKAYKQSIITEAVTRGLNPNVPMRNSGIEWIGEIPQHWTIENLTKIIWLRARLGWRGLKAEEYVESGYPFLSAFNIVDNKLIWSDLNYITQERYDESPEIKLSEGDVLIVKDGAGIGKCARVDSLPCGEATVNSSLGVITPSERLNYAYLHYFLLGSTFQNMVLFLKNGMGVPHLTQENMKSVKIQLPPLNEQQEIVKYLDSKCADIDALIALRQDKIDTLKEYKKSLIFEYVTGKKQVV